MTKQTVSTAGIQFVKLQVLDPSGNDLDLTQCGFSNPDLPLSYKNPKYENPKIDPTTYWGPR